MTENERPLAATDAVLAAVAEFNRTARQDWCIGSEFLPNSRCLADLRRAHFEQAFEIMEHVIKEELALARNGSEGVGPGYGEADLRAIAVVAARTCGRAAALLANARELIELIDRDGHHAAKPMKAWP